MTGGRETFLPFFLNPSNVKVYIRRPYYQYIEYYCTFQKHANSEVQKQLSQMHF